MPWSFERVAGPFDAAAGGVAWDGAHVLFSLPAADTIMRFDPSSGETHVHRRYSCGADGLAIGGDGAVYACQSTSRRVARLDPDGSAVVLPYRLDGRIHNFPRDLAVDAGGAIWFSDPRGDLVSPGPQIYPLLDHASVLRLTPVPRKGWRLERMTFDTAAPSAICISADGRTLYVSENDPSPPGRRELRAYAVDGDRLGAHAVLHCFGADARGVQRGIDGMCLDAGGNVVACAGGPVGPGPAVYVFTPEGRVLSAEPAPAEPVGCAFGDGDLGSLYVTTATGELLRTRDAGRG